MLPKAEQWFEAARRGDDETIAQLLEENRDYLFKKETWSRQIALHFAIEHGRENVVARLLAADPNSIDEVDVQEWSAVHFAASFGQERVLDQLLAAHPSCVTKTIGRSGRTALHCAAQKGHATIVDKLLAASPTLIAAVAIGNRTVLHEAAASGQEHIVMQLLQVKPSLASTADDKGNLALHFGANAAHDGVVAQLLAVHPEAARARNKAKQIPLHFAATCHVRPLITRLLHAYPEGMRVGDVLEKTPLRLAVSARNDMSVDLLQQGFSYDELVDMLESNWTARLLPLQQAVAKQCEPLWQWLYQDLIGEVFEYIGLEVSPREPAHNVRIHVAHTDDIDSSGESSSSGQNNCEGTMKAVGEQQ